MGACMRAWAGRCVRARAHDARVRASARVHPRVRICAGMARVRSLCRCVCVCACACVCICVCAMCVCVCRQLAVAAQPVAGCP